ncbi:MAG: hypothetical protein AAB527_04090 [Patescibacteria group bacterium]
MMCLNYKKIISLALILAALILFLPLNNLYAQQATQQPTTQQPVSGQAPSAGQQNTSVAKALADASCGLPVLWALACPIVYGVAWLVFVILMAVSAFFALFGNLFDLVTAVTLNPKTYALGAIYDGWVIARDTANLFFIFILLTIAIATILQIETYGAKKLLPKLIIAAIFINFSFLLTQYVIYTSNLLTGFFLPGATEGVAHNQLSVKFLSGINPNEMYKGTKFNYEDINKIETQLNDVRLKISENLAYLDESSTDEEIRRAQEQFAQNTAEEKRLGQQLETAQKDQVNTLIQMIIAMLGVIAFILVATGALAFAGITLLIRVVVLWFLMILSPVAFLFYVVPGLSSHAKQWWDTLIKQAFFAPAFFFLFSLTVQMISSREARDQIFRLGDELSRNSGAVGTALIVSFVSVGYYALLIIMLLASVIVAKQMGGVTAQWADKGYQYAKGAALGYTGRVARKYAVEATGAVGKAVTSGEGRVAQFLRQTPYVNKMFGAMETIQRKEVKKYEKQYGSYSIDALRNIDTAPGLRVASERNAIKNLIKKREEQEKENKTLREGSVIDKVRVLAKRTRREKEETEQAKQEAEEKNPKT